MKIFTNLLLAGAALMAVAFAPAAFARNTCGDTCPPGYVVCPTNQCACAQLTTFTWDNGLCSMTTYVAYPNESCPSDYCACHGYSLNTSGSTWTCTTQSECNGGAPTYNTVNVPSSIQAQGQTAAQNFCFTANPCTSKPPACGG